MRLKEIQYPLFMLFKLIDAHLAEVTCLPLGNGRRGSSSQTLLLLNIHHLLALSLFLEGSFLDFMSLSNLEVKVEIDLLLIGLVILL